MNEVPTKGGFYWAKWKIADEGVAPEYDYTPGPWEPVELIIEPGRAIVEMMSMPHQQSADCFHWGPRLEPPEDKPKDVEVQNGIDNRAVRAYLGMTREERAAWFETAKTDLRPKR